MQRKEIKELYYVTPRKNISSILQRGILSHNEVRRTIGEPAIWHNKDVQQIRSSIIITCSHKPLHDYINLYFNCRNAALYSRLEIVHDLCILSIDSAVCDDIGVVITPFNAASNKAHFFYVKEGLPRLSSANIFKKTWQNEDGTTNINTKDQMMAELLIPRTVQPFFIKRIYVSSYAVEQQMESLGLGIAIQTWPGLFFQGLYQSPLEDNEKY